MTMVNISQSYHISQKDLTQKNNSSYNLDLKLYNINYGKWTSSENRCFLTALILFGNNWTNIQNFLKTRTINQILSHSQKFFIKIKKLQLFHIPFDNPFRLKEYFFNGNLKDKFEIVIKLIKFIKLKKYEQMIKNLYNDNFFDIDKNFKDFYEFSKKQYYIEKLENFHMLKDLKESAAILGKFIEVIDNFQSIVFHKDIKFNNKPIENKTIKVLEKSNNEENNLEKYLDFCRIVNNENILKTIESSTKINELSDKECCQKFSMFNSNKGRNFNKKNILLEKNSKEKNGIKKEKNIKSLIKTPTKEGKNINTNYFKNDLEENISKDSNKFDSIKCQYLKFDEYKNFFNSSMTEKNNYLINESKCDSFSRDISQASTLDLKLNNSLKNKEKSNSIFYQVESFNHIKDRFEKIDYNLDDEKTLTEQSIHSEDF